MKTRTILSAAALVLAFALPAQDDGTVPPPAEQPKDVAPSGQIESGGANDWFEKTRLFLGDFLDVQEVKGAFPFKNPTAETIRFENFQGSCQCARAVIAVGSRTYELSKQPVANSLHLVVEENGQKVRKLVRHLDVEPKESGSVTVFMELGGLQGLKEATLAISTSDPNMKQVTLRWQAKGVKLFTVTPNEVYLNDMKWDDSRKFAFVVESEVNPDFKLLDHDPLPDFVKIAKSEITQPNGKKAWRVEGTFGPNADERAGGAVIKFKTDWQGKEVSMNVIANVTGPFTVTPGTFLSFGKIKKGEGCEREIKITPNTDFDLALESVDFPSLTFDKKYISATAAHKGKDLVVTVKIAPEVDGAFLIRGSMVLHLNHPSLKEKSFNFNGILR